MRRKTSTLFVTVPSAQADQTEAALAGKGLTISRADNVCVAEMMAAAERYEAAVYDRSITQEEQASLARVMRVRWPWMRLLRLLPAGEAALDDALFDCSAASLPELVAGLK